MRTVRCPCAVFCMVLGLASVSHSAEQRPNFVLFLADDISWDDMGCYGHATIRTPHIDQLAANGLRFTNAYLTISSCSPSRCSIITGRYPHNTGAPELHTPLPDDQVLFPELLKNNGYFTLLSGKNHMGDTVHKAFSEVSAGKGPGKEADWVELLRQRPQDKPFFCWYASTDAHRGWQVNDEAPQYDPASVVIPPYLVDGPQTREDLTGYYHEVSRFDHFVGQVVLELERQNVLQTTMIIVMADNGRPFPRCKTRLYDSGIKTPFVVHYPEMVKPAVTEGLVSTIDIAATFLQLAGIEAPKRIQGVSFSALLTDPGATTREVVFAEHNWHVYRNHERMVRTDEWLYIRNNFFDKQNLCVEAYMGEAGKELWDAAKAGQLTSAQENIFQNPCPREELYHVGDDPDQLRNVVDQPRNAAALKQMRKLLEQWSEETGDTIPARPTPDRDAPPGSAVRDKRNFRHLEMPGDAQRSPID